MRLILEAAHVTEVYIRIESLSLIVIDRPNSTMQTSISKTWVIYSSPFFSASKSCVSDPDGILETSLDLQKLERSSKRVSRDLLNTDAHDTLLT